MNNNKLLDLETENREYACTGGVSLNNSDFCFIPAFKDLESGRIEKSKFANGSLAPFHLLDGMPPEWIIDKDSSNRVTKIKEGIVSGFVLSGIFYSRDEAARYVTEHPFH